MQSGAEKKVLECFPKSKTAPIDENNYGFGDVESIDSDGTKVYFGLPRWPHSSIILILEDRN